MKRNMFLTYVLAPDAVRNVCTICQFSSFICEMITVGWYIPVAASAAPKAAPERKESNIKNVFV